MVSRLLCPSDHCFGGQRARRRRRRSSLDPRPPSAGARTLRRRICGRFDHLLPVPGGVCSVRVCPKCCGAGGGLAPLFPILVRCLTDRHRHGCKPGQLAGASIPLLLRGDTKLLAALKRSVELSSGYEGALFLLVVESVAGTFVAAYGTFYALHLLVPSTLRYTPWYGWVVNLIAMLVSAAVEPPLFIGFSLLAEPEQLNVPSLPAFQQTT